jgi:MarR family transcriptional regulator, organic hydroperoxide resistance regulator
MSVSRSKQVAAKGGGQRRAAGKAGGQRRAAGKARGRDRDAAPADADGPPAEYVARTSAPAPAARGSMPRPRGDPGLELTPYATGPAGEAWALAMKLFFSSGKPRFVAIGQELDLSPPQGHALRLLVTPRPMGELARLMHCDSSNITGIVDRLEERGMVERRPAEQDRRVKLIALTPRGDEIRERLGRAMAQPPQALEELPRADQETLRDILRRAVGE